MSYQSFDPRTTIISTIGYSWDIDRDGTDESCISFSYPDGPMKGSTCYVPMYLPSECRTGELPYMPFIEVTLVNSPSEVHNAQGDIKLDEIYFDLNIYVQNNDEINLISTWVKACKNEIADKIMQNRHCVSGCSWMETIDSGREIIETHGKINVFHYVVSCYGFNYQSG